MARITVEDCLDNVDSRFQLVLVASKRARQLINGSPTELNWENDKPTVLALREIAKGLIGPSILEPAKPEEVFEEVFETGDDIESQARAMLEAERNAEVQIEANTVIDTSEKPAETTEAKDETSEPGDSEGS